MSFTSETRERSRPVLPLAGMVDILFLLLVFFITASTLREQEAAIPLQLTPAETAQADAAAGTHTMISIKPEAAANGKVHWGQGPPITLQALKTKLQQLVEISPNETIIIRGDQASNYGMFIRVLDLAKQTGVKDVRVAASKPENGTEGGS
jgi:biopolymer transport protein ExbD